MNIVKFDRHRGDYPKRVVTLGSRPGETRIETEPAQILLKYKNMICVTSALPTDIPDTSYGRPETRATLRLDTQGVLGGCWNAINVSSGSEKMEMYLKLPRNSPVAVSKVRVIDESNHLRCWTSYWRDDPDQNYNQQTNQWVAGKAFYETRFGNMAPEMKNNFEDDCTM